MEEKTTQQLYDKQVEIANIIIDRIDLIQDKTDGLYDNFMNVMVALEAQNGKIAELQENIITLQTLVREKSL